MKEFKVKIVGGDTENLILSSYGDDYRDKTLVILVKEFNMMIEDGDPLKENDVGEEQNPRTSRFWRNETSWRR